MSRICIVSQAPINIYGGYEKVLESVSDYLEKEGHLVYYVNITRNTTLAQAVEPYKSRAGKTYLIRCSEFCKSILCRLIHHYDGTLLKEYLRSIQPELIIATSPFIIKTIRSNYQSVPIIGWYHLPLIIPQKKIRRLIHLVDYLYLKRTLKFADFHIAISRGIARQIKKVASDVIVKIIYNPVGCNNVQIIGNSEEPIFAYIGRIDDKQKNISFMLKGLSRIKRDWRLIMIGTGPDESYVKQLLLRLGLSKKVNLMGFKKDPFAPLSNGVKALLLTSRYEGLPTVLIEAIQRGIPVIASSCSDGIEDIVIPYENGCIFKGDSVSEFINLIEMIIDNKINFPDRLTIAKSVQKFNRDVNLKKFLDIVNETIAEHKK